MSIIRAINSLSAMMGLMDITGLARRVGFLPAPRRSKPKLNSGTGEGTERARARLAEKRRRNAEIRAELEMQGIKPVYSRQRQRADARSQAKMKRITPAEAARRAMAEKKAALQTVGGF